MNRKPKTFLVGVTQPDMSGLREYLEHTDQIDFLYGLQAWLDEKGDDPLCLVSFYAKLCYKSLVEGKNANVTKIRAMEDNLKGVIASGHGSVFEHVWLNFVSTDVSRVFTHELVRHRVGTAFSQTSGRYVAIDQINLVLPPELEEHDDLIYEYTEWLTGTLEHLREQLIHDVQCEMCGGGGTRLGYDGPHPTEPAKEITCTVCKGTGKVPMSFEKKKRYTSAIRRLAPNGQTNEIGWSVNVRALRHLLELRTSVHAEWEIRQVFGEVGQIVHDRWPLMLHGAVYGEVIDGVAEVKGLKI